MTQQFQRLEFSSADGHDVKVRHLLFNEFRLKTKCFNGRYAYNLCTCIIIPEVGKGGGMGVSPSQNVENISLWYKNAIKSENLDFMTLILG